MRPIRNRLAPSWGLLALAFALAPGVALGQARAVSDVLDDAGLFDQKAVATVKAQLERIERDRGIPTVIETIDSLGARALGEMARIEQERLNPRGLFVLIPRREHKIEVLIAPELKGDVTEAQRRAIQDAFIGGFRRGRFDEGLLRGVQEIDQELAAAKAPAGTPALDRLYRNIGVGRTKPPLVVREQVRLTLAGARTIIAGAEAKAEEMKLKVNIAVVDDGGHLLAFERMDGARPASISTATTKAVTAAMLRQETGPLPTGATNPDPLLNLSLQNAAAAGGGKFTTLSGGIPVVVDDQVIGGIGVGGNTGEQDATVARAGLAAFQAELASSTSKTPEEKSAPDADLEKSEDQPATER